METDRSYSLLVLPPPPPPPPPLLESGDQLQQIGHFKSCMTEIYLHIDARMADYQVTSYSTLVAKMPIALENDRVAIAAALATTPPRPGLGRRWCAIKNTLSLQDVLVSEACVPLLEGCVYTLSDYGCVWI